MDFGMAISKREAARAAVVGRGHICPPLARHVIRIVCIHIGRKKAVVDARAFIQENECVYRARTDQVCGLSVTEIRYVPKQIGRAHV